MSFWISVLKMFIPFMTASITLHRSPVAKIEYIIFIFTSSKSLDLNLLQFSNLFTLADLTSRTRSLQTQSLPVWQQMPSNGS